MLGDCLEGDVGEGAAVAGLLASLEGVRFVLGCVALVVIVVVVMVMRVVMVMSLVVCIVVVMCLTIFNLGVLG